MEQLRPRHLPATWNGPGVNPWPHTRGATVAANGCENCHTPHAAGTKPQLLNFAKTEDNCLVCHNGNVAAKNLTGRVQQAQHSPHPRHLLAARRGGRRMSPSGRHVSCVDCHNPHAARSAASTSLGLSGSLAQVKGVTAGGGPVQVASHEYEICFRCHAESGSRSTSRISASSPSPTPASSSTPATPLTTPWPPLPNPPRAAPSFPPGPPPNRSFAPTATTTTRAPGSRAPGQTARTAPFTPPCSNAISIRRTFSPKAPPPMPCATSATARACSWPTGSTAGTSATSKTACSTCHDAHGVQSQPHLINFNTLYVKPFNGLHEL